MLSLTIYPHNPPAKGMTYKPRLKKLYALSNRRIISKYDYNGTIVIEDWDFRDTDNQVESRGDLPQPLNSGVSYWHIRNGDLTINWGTTEAAPAERLRYTEPNSETFPKFFFVDTGETETLEDPSDFVVPSWIPAGYSTAFYVAKHKDDVSYWARWIFDAGLQHHWPHTSAQVTDVCLDLHRLPADRTPKEAEAIERFDNTSNWGRLFMGYVWREMHRVNQPGGKTVNEMDALIAKMKAEFPNDAHIKVWYAAHNRLLWSIYTADSDDAGSRQIWTTNALGAGGELIYDINAANTQNGVLDAAAAEAEYADLVLNQYGLAFANNVGR